MSTAPTNRLSRNLRARFASEEFASEQSLRGKRCRTIEHTRSRPCKPQSRAAAEGGARPPPQSLSKSKQLRRSWPDPRGRSGGLGLWALGRNAEVSEDVPGDGRVLDRREQTQPPPASGTRENVDLEFTRRRSAQAAWRRGFARVRAGGSPASFGGAPCGAAPRSGPPSIVRRWWRGAERLRWRSGNRHVVSLQPRPG